MQRVGIFVDGSNVYANGGNGMRYDVLRQFACRDGAVPVRLNAYVSYDKVRAESDAQYRDKNQAFFRRLRDYGYKVIIKEVKWFSDGEGERYAKANADLDLAVDALLQSSGLDRVLLVSGDGDFTQVVRALQNKGCRVELLAFGGVSGELRREVDFFMSGYMVPDLLGKQTGEEGQWGSLGTKVYGVCEYFRSSAGFGFMRYLSEINDTLWIPDVRENKSPWKQAYFHISDMPEGTDPLQLKRFAVYSFELHESDKGDGSYVAKNIELVTQ